MATVRNPGPTLAAATALLAAVRQRSGAACAFPAAAVGTAGALGTIWVKRRMWLLGEGIPANNSLRNLLAIAAKANWAGPPTAPGEQSAGHQER